MRWRKDVLEAIAGGANRYSAIKSRISIPDASLYGALNDLMNAGLIKETTQDIYELTPIGAEVLKIAKRAEKEGGIVLKKRGEDPIVGSGIQARVFKSETMSFQTVKLNPEEPAILNIKLYKLPCGHRVPFEEEMTCPICGDTWEVETNRSVRAIDLAIFGAMILGIAYVARESRISECPPSTSLSFSASARACK